MEEENRTEEKKDTDTCNCGKCSCCTGEEKDKEGKSEKQQCPTCKIDLNKEEGCMKCPKCGWGMCTI